MPFFRLLFAIPYCLGGISLKVVGLISNRFFSSGRQQPASDLFKVVMLGLFLGVWVTPVQAAGYSGGTGTSADPYLIANLADLQELQTASQSANLSGKYFKQTADIDLTGVAWTGISNGSLFFAGTYDGDRYAIQNLTVNKTGPGPSTDLSQKYGGFFTRLAGTVRNLAITGANVLVTNTLNTDNTSASFAGILAGYTWGATISNVYTTGTVGINGLGTNAGSSAGGIVGWLSASSSITFSYSTATVNFDIDPAVPSTKWFTGGGIAGNVSGSTITNCFASGQFSANQNTSATFKFGEIAGTVADQSDLYTHLSPSPSHEVSSGGGLKYPGGYSSRHPTRSSGR